MNHKITRGLEGVINHAGRWVSLLILVIMATTSFEVISRYAFNRPTIWVWLINKQLFGVFVMTAGSYTLIQKSHIRIEMIYDAFPQWLKRALQWLTLFPAVCFLGSLLWKSAIMGWEAFKNHEVATGVFRLPLYPLKLYMPFATLLFLLGCLVVFTRKK
jgi:TRAP-type mannitol/chloroaromatic compound transport system permease small subunit